jgi:hypothetical protein
MIATTSPTNRRGPDDLDDLLGRFFRGEVPTPWPETPAPVITPAVSHRPAARSAGRVALAASVAALLAGGWFLSGRLPAPAPSAGSLESGGAVVPSTLRNGALPSHPHR